MRAFASLLLIAGPLLRAGIVDRLAVTVGHDVITELQVDEEIRVTAFLNRKTISRGVDERRAAADRLISQLLVKHEMELSHYPLPDANDVDAYLRQVRETFQDSDFDAELTSHELTQSTLREHIALQLTMLRFVEFRFRPDVNISDTDIETYYKQKVEEWRASHPGTPPPSLDSWRDSIRQALIEARTDEVLNIWLEETRKQFNIVYLDKSLQ